MKRYIKGVMPYLIIEVLLDIGATLMVAIVPYLQKLLFDVGISGGLPAVIKIAIAFALVHILWVVFENVCMRFSWKSAIKFEKMLKRDFISSIFNMKSTEFYRHDIGEYISLQGNDIIALDQDYLQPMVDVIRSINMFIIYGIILFAFVDWRIAITILLASCLTVIGPKVTGEIMSQKRNAFQEQVAVYTSKIKDLFEGFNLISSRTKEKINATHEKALNLTSKKRYMYGKAKTTSLSVNNLTINCVQIASFVVAGILMVNGEITIGTGVATFGYVTSFLSPIGSILYDITAIQSVKEIKKRVLGFINERHEEQYIPQRFEQKISCENVNIKRGEFELNDINFTFEKGKKYAVIGHSGSGKSTLINLLMGYIQADNGDVLIDGNTVSSLDLSYICSSVSQHEHIYQAGFADNATIYGSFDKENLKKKQNSIKASIMNAVYKKGADDNCQELSGGEKQALAFLRILTQDSPIVIFDEPFSAVDKNTTEYFEKYLLTSGEYNEKTIIMVTHDLSEHLDYFDEIILMKDGRICASGDYQTLSNTHEYKELYNHVAV